MRIKPKVKPDMFGSSKIIHTFATQSEIMRVAKTKNLSGCSAARLAHLLWEQGVPGSNPGTPTKRT